MTAHTVTCCQELREEVEQDDMLAIRDTKPFGRDPLPAPTVYILSDSGHGGCLPIRYCPFCGAEIEIVACTAFYLPSSAPARWSKP